MSRRFLPVQIGDEVKISSDFKECASQYLNKTMVVIEIFGTHRDDGTTLIKCRVQPDSKNPMVDIFHRYQLCRTGFKVKPSYEKSYEAENELYSAALKEHINSGAFTVQGSEHITGKKCCCDMTAIMSIGCKCGGK